MSFAKRRFLRCILSAALLSLLPTACGSGKSGSGSSSANTVSGKITYKRLGIKVDANGYPQGLESPDAATTLPLRGIVVRAVYAKEETMPDGSKVKLWQISSWTSTDASGEYSLNLPGDGTSPTFIEIQSAFVYQADASSFFNIRIVADPLGMFSPTHIADRDVYSIRVGLDGIAPMDNPVPGLVKPGQTRLDIDIGLEDKWWIGHPDPKFAPDAVLEVQGTGSRIAAIIDTAYTAAASFGDPTPGYILDLHYLQGRTEPLGTYVEYDRERTPLAFDLSDSTGSTHHYFGSVRGGPQHDDAWDEGMLLSMMAKNRLWGGGISGLFPFPPRKFPGFDTRNLHLTQNIQPSMALVEGLPEAMAAVTIKTPYLTSSSGTEVRDIRDTSGLVRDIYSGASIAAFSWEIALRANDMGSPGTPDTWKNISIGSINRFFNISSQSETNEQTDRISILDLPSLFTQLESLKGEKLLNEPIDLAKIFSDSVITQMTTQFFGTTIWPRPTNGVLARFLTDWGNDPDSAKNPLPVFGLTMSDAVPDAEGLFSNLTFKENMTAKLTVTKDSAYWLSVTTVPVLAGGASLEIRNDVNALPTIHFYTTSPNPQRIVLVGNSDEPTTYLMNFSLKSQAAKIPDTQVSVRFDSAN